MSPAARSGHDSIREFAGDAAGAAALRDGLGQLARHHAGTPLGERMAAVLAGRLDMRQLAVDPEMTTFAHEHTRRFSEEWDSLDAQGRADLVARGTGLTDLLDPTDSPGSPDPGPDTTGRA